jgi:hypothetical protein
MVLDKHVLRGPGPELILLKLRRANINASVIASRWHFTFYFNLSLTSISAYPNRFSPLHADGLLILA